MPSSELENFFDSFVDNDLRRFALPCFHRMVWTGKTKKFIGDFSEDVGCLLEGAEILLEEKDQLSAGRAKYLGEIAILCEEVEDFYHTFYRDNSDEKVILFLDMSEWGKIVKLASKIYGEIKKELWWKNSKFSR